MDLTVLTKPRFHLTEVGNLQAVVATGRDRFFFKKRKTRCFSPSFVSWTNSSCSAHLDNSCLIYNPAVSDVPDAAQRCLVFLSLHIADSLPPRRMTVLGSRCQPMEEGFQDAASGLTCRSKGSCLCWWPMELPLALTCGSVIHLVDSVSWWLVFCDIPFNLNQTYFFMNFSGQKYFTITNTPQFTPSLTHWPGKMDATVFKANLVILICRH